MSNPSIPVGSLGSEPAWLGAMPSPIGGDRHVSLRQGVATVLRDLLGGESVTSWTANDGGRHNHLDGDLL